MELFSQEIDCTRAKTILEALPAARRNTYIALSQESSGSTDQNLILAAKLYVWNGYLASVIDRTTGEVEVLLRNFMDTALREWNSEISQEGTTEWLTAPTGKLTEIVHPKNGNPLSSFAHLDSVIGSPTHDDYVAGLTFGNWLHLLPKKHAKSNNPRVIIWEEAFAPRLNCQDRVAFQNRVKYVKDMRNRATHRRPLIKNLTSIELTHQSCVEVAFAINQDIGSWLKGERWILNGLRENPLADP